jgi:CO/xanthine dehydrogenase Mo-binding subunit
MSVRIPSSLDELPVSAARWVGRAVNRVEDPGLLTGRTEFVDDVSLTGMLHCAILRSPIAHARVVKVDTSAAELIEVEYEPLEVVMDPVKATEPGSPLVIE